MKRQKVAIITSGYFPIPPVKGGAIETLVNILYEENATQQELDLAVFSVYDEEAAQKQIREKHNKVMYVKISKIVQTMDHVSYFIFKNILKKKKHMSYRYIFQRLYYINAVSKKIADADYDKLVIENHPTLLGVLKKYNNYQKYKGKYYYHAHNEILRTFGYDNYLKRARGYICVSNFIGSKMQELLPEYPKSRISVLRNRVDEKKFREIDEKRIASFRKKYHIPGDKLLFTFIGRLNPEKGVKELLMAYRAAKPEAAKLVIAGSYYFGSGIKSEYEEELKTIAEDLKDDIIFTGNIDYEDMPYMYAVSDVIVLPSIWNDPAPLTVIESLTCGKPLITTYSGGIPEYANSNNSIVLKIDDSLVNELAITIKELSRNRGKREKLTAEAIKESAQWEKNGYYRDFVSLMK